MWDRYGMLSELFDRLTKTLDVFLQECPKVFLLNCSTEIISKDLGQNYKETQY